MILAVLLVTLTFTLNSAKTINDGANENSNTWLSLHSTTQRLDNENNSEPVISMRVQNKNSSEQMPTINAAQEDVTAFDYKIPKIMSESQDSSEIAQISNIDFEKLAVSTTSNVGISVTNEIIEPMSHDRNAEITTDTVQLQFNTIIKNDEQHVPTTKERSRERPPSSKQSPNIKAKRKKRNKMKNRSQTVSATITRRHEKLQNTTNDPNRNDKFIHNTISNSHSENKRASTRKSIVDVSTKDDTHREVRTTTKTNCIPIGNTYIKSPNLLVKVINNKDKNSDIENTLKRLSAFDIDDADIKDITKINKNSPEIPSVFDVAQETCNNYETVTTIPISDEGFGYVDPRIVDHINKDVIRSPEPVWSSPRRWPLLLGHRILQPCCL